MTGSFGALLLSVLLPSLVQIPTGTIISNVLQTPWDRTYCGGDGDGDPPPPCQRPEAYFSPKVLSSPKVVSGRLYTDFSLQAKRYDFFGLGGINGSVSSTLMLFESGQQFVWGNLESATNDLFCTQSKIARPPLSALNSTILGNDLLPLYGICNRTAGLYDGYFYVLWTSNDFGGPVLFVVKSNSTEEEGFVRFYFGNQVVATTDPIVFKPPAKACS